MLRGAVTDRDGDVTRRCGSTRPQPDLTAATIEVNGGRVTLTLSFAARTLTIENVDAHVSLDTDQNPATGFPGLTTDDPTDADLLGVDYVVALLSPKGSPTANIAKTGGTLSAPTWSPVGTAPVTFPAADQMQVTFPLALLGGTDGHMNFKATVVQWIVDTPSRQQTTCVLDYMPDVGRSPGTVQ
jgi:hypothetical protein